MTKTQILEQIEKELAGADQARRVGNDGMIRVCARRAAGIAIGHWLEDNSHLNWGIDAMSRLQNIQLDDSMPVEIRNAATRLTTKITQQFTSPFTTDPIQDCNIIIHHLLK